MNTPQEPSKVPQIFKSKMFWVKVTAFVAVIVQTKYGFAIDEPTQTQIVSIIQSLIGT